MAFKLLNKANEQKDITKLTSFFGLNTLSLEASQAYAPQQSAEENSIIAKSTGRGKDFLVFKLRKNKHTLQSAGDAQGGYFKISNRAPRKGDQISIIGHGDSGAPILNSEGEVIGIHNLGKCHPFQGIYNSGTMISGQTNLQRAIRNCKRR